MYPQTHLIIGLIVSFILYPFFGLNVLIILFCSLLIDTDHYTSYIFQKKGKKDYNLKKAFNWHATRQWEKDKITPFTFLHFIEFLIILFVLSFRFPLFLYIFIGFIIHLPFDIIKELIARKFKLEKYSLFVYLAKA